MTPAQFRVTVKYELRDGKTHYLYIQFYVHQIFFFITWFHIFFFFKISLSLFRFLKIQFDKQQSTDYIMNYHENPFLYMISIPENTEIQNNWNIRGTKHFHFRGNDNNIDILCSLNPILKKCISMYFQWFGVSVLHTHLNALKFIFINKNHANNSQCHPISTKKKPTQM